MLRLPAEFELQEAIMLSWPNKNSDWKIHLPQVIPVFCQIVQLIAKHQPVIIAVHDLFDKIELTHTFSSYKNVFIYITQNNDTWARDYGPITTYNDINGQRNTIINDFQFNGWGGKYPFYLDNRITQKLAKQHIFGSTPIHTHPFILEGGSIESDGLGTILTTKKCLLNTNRNPNLTQYNIESMLKETLGAKHVLWLSEGQLEGDDTDAHIDTLARFCSPEDIAYCCADKNDHHFESLTKMKTELETFTNHQGKPYRLHPLPLPSSIYNKEGDRLPATYANFLIINDAVLVPVYQDKKDTLAIDIIQKLFPARSVYPVNCRSIIEQYGSLHCLTMQIPKLHSSLLSNG
jgi:agmatine deiminase